MIDWLFVIRNKWIHFNFQGFAIVCIRRDLPKSAIQRCLGTDNIGLPLTPVIFYDDLKSDIIVTSKTIVGLWINIETMLVYSVKQNEELFFFDYLK